MASRIVVFPHVAAAENHVEAGAGRQVSPWIPRNLSMVRRRMVGLGGAWVAATRSAAAVGSSAAVSFVLDCIAAEPFLQSPATGQPRPTRRCEATHRSSVRRLESIPADVDDLALAVRRCYVADRR